MTGRDLRRLTMLLAVAVVLALASSAVAGTRMEIQDWDCPPAPDSCARPMLVKGFPFPYISDYHGISVSGSAGLVGALLGEDLFHWDAFAWNVIAYFIIAFVAWFIVRKATGRWTA